RPSERATADRGLSVLLLLPEQLTHLRAEPITVGPTDDLRVYAEGDSRVTVPDLSLDVRHVEPGRKHESDVGAPEGVRCDVRQDRRLVALARSSLARLRTGNTTRARTLSLVRRRPVAVRNAGDSIAAWPSAAR